ncbi:MAG: PD-(D/E)XK nuclease family protein [Halieaceae bacterium]|jgi:probable DNA repair protein|nr:PD-(D/E)XK nuclease family protein [Halieaceae bacterium]
MLVNSEFNFYPLDALVEPLSANAPILTPNHRLARRIRLAWGRYQGEQGRSAWTSPRAMSLEHWWQTCYRQRCLAGDSLPGLLNPQQERALWLQCVEASDQVTLLRPAVAAELAADAWRNLTLWKIDWRDAATAQQFLFAEDTEIFLDWAARFDTALARLDLAPLATLVAQLAQACPESCIWLAEFDELPPLYRSALQSQAGKLVEHRAEKASAQCFLQPCPSHRDELEAAARWAHQQHTEAPQRRIGILLPQLQQERGEIERLLAREFDSDHRRPDSLPVNFSAGTPLADCGPVRAALSLLRLPVRDQTLAELGQVFTTRYRYRDEQAAEELAWARLIDDAREPVSPAALRGALGRATSGESGAPDAHAGLAAVLLNAGDPRGLRTAQPMEQWPQLFTELLTEFGWPGPGPLDSLEFQQVEQFHAVLAQLATLTPVIPEPDYRGALAALEQLCSHAPFQPQTPDAPIQVLGTLEAAGLQFDAIWICNMGAGEWPPAARPNPFVPVQMQRNAGMPHADARRELAYAEQLLAHLESSTRLLVASYASLEEEVSVAPSALVAGFEQLPEVAARYWPGYWQRAGQGSLESVPVRAAPAVATEEAGLIRGGSAILGNQAQCPFRAFARHRLGAHPLPEPEAALGAADRGAILHEALYHLWGELEDSQALRALDEPARRLLATRSAETAIESFRQGRGRRENPGLLRLEQARLVELMVSWLAVEAERADFTVSAREERHEIGFGDLSITLRVDRIDQLADGRKLLIDYKTGDAKTRLWLGQRPEDPQLPLYAQLLPPEEVEGVGFGVLRHSAIEYRGLARGDQGGGLSGDVAGASAKTDTELPDWDSLQAHWAAALKALAQEFLDGHAAVQPLDPRRTCTFCGLEGLCRIR